MRISPCCTKSIASGVTELNAAHELQKRIRATIPLADAMQFSIGELDVDRIRVSAPLEPNVNIHGTGFAGSLYSLAVLTGWALCMHLIDSFGLDAELVVGKGEIRYRAPVRGPIECRTACGIAEREAFAAGIRDAGKGKMRLEITVGDAAEAVLDATFVALRR